MPWVCTTRAFPWVVRVARTSQSGLPAVPHHRGIGRRFRRHLVKSWGVSHGAAATAWGAVTTCVWVGGIGGAAGGVAGGAWEVWRQLPGGIAPGAAGAVLGSPGVDVGGLGPVAAVPEPSTLVVLAVAVGVLAVLNEWRRAKRRRVARVSQFTGWPPPKPGMISMEDDGLGSARALLVGLVLGLAFWALLLVPAWIWGIL